jgi:hypothetical protein
MQMDMQDLDDAGEDTYNEKIEIDSAVEELKDRINAAMASSKKSKPFNADKDEADFENALEGDGFSSYDGGSLEGVSTFGDENGNTVAIAAGSVYDSKSAFVVSGFNDDDPADVESKEFDSKAEAMAYAKKLGQKLKKQNPNQKYAPNSDEPKSDTPKVQPRKVGKKLEAKVDKISAKLGLDPKKLGKEEYEKRMLSLVHDVLEDANFHGENRAIFAYLMGNPKLAQEPDYSKAPEFGSPAYEKWKDENTIYGSGFKNMTSEFDGVNSAATSITGETGWNGQQSLDAILNKMRKDGSGELADKIQAAFDKTQNEGTIKLMNLLRK